MNRYSFISFMALLSFIIILPLYATKESQRMTLQQGEYRRQIVSEGAELYVDHCRMCHGDAGEGVGAMPPLDNPAFSEIDPTKLFRTIARAAHGSQMSAWHIDEGGMLNDYQINELVEFIRFADWEEASRLAQAAGKVELLPTAYEIGEAYLEVEPHDCVSCHEDPPVHAGLFGVACERCHNTITWTPAYLTRHTFYLDHGGDGQVACETCHIENYYTNTCYECHDHTPEDMEEVHLAENISLTDYETCHECHPTGEAGEAGRLKDEGLLGLSEFKAIALLVSSEIPPDLLGGNRR